MIFFGPPIVGMQSTHSPFGHEKPVVAGVVPDVFVWTLVVLFPILKIGILYLRAYPIVRQIIKAQENQSSVIKFFLTIYK